MTQQPFTVHPEHLKDKVDIVFAEAKERLGETSDGYKSLYNKATFALGIIATLSTGVVAFIAKEHLIDGDMTFLVPLTVYFVLVGFSAWHLVPILFATKVHGNGYDPRILMVDKHMEDSKEVFLQKLLTEYATKIDGNEKINANIGTHVTMGIIFALAAFAALCVLYVFALIMRSSSPFHPARWPDHRPEMRTMQEERFDQRFP